MGLFDKLFGGDEETTSTQTSAPWAELQPHLKNIFGRAEGLAGQPQQFFPGQTYAGLNPYQQQGMQSQLGYAGGGLADQVGAAQQAQLGALQAPDVANNPYIGGVADTITDRLNRNFSENLMPGIQGGATMAGQSGGSRQGVAEGIAARGTQEALGSSLNQLYGDAYGRGLQAQSAAMGMAPQMAQLGMMPGQVQQQVGGQMRAEDQMGIDEAVARHDFEQQEPWQRLGQYNALLGGGQGYGSTTSTTTQPSQGLFGNLLGAGMMGVGMMTGNPMMALGGAGNLFGSRSPSIPMGTMMAPSSGWRFN